ncbi:nucleotidyltransferase domain-containing protein [Dapis sp. BLCC M229]|uniref:nucleotidyltransferase domain-containing protein n=1 Tax=Dapis sp. BLCC M229 TaxID=3400188 RepID=UPI003CF10E88
MPIPEIQLSTWAKSQQTQLAINTHESIRKALNYSRSKLKLNGFSEGKHFEIYLQGSYRNKTNIRADSDVDVVVQLNTIFCSNKSQINPLDRKRYDSVFKSYDYTWDNFDKDILMSLQSYYSPDNITTGNKSIKLQKGSNRIAADIIPCIEYRYYYKFESEYEDYIPGICFYTRDSRKKIINYPKLHFHNGADKNSKTNQNYKPTVRLFKNAKKIIINRYSYLLEAPSYYIECLLYNVPNNCFVNNRQDTYIKVVNWLCENLNSSFICQNEMLNLFGNKLEQWKLEDAEYFIQSLIKLWKDW